MEQIHIGLHTTKTAVHVKSNMTGSSNWRMKTSNILKICWVIQQAWTTMQLWWLNINQRNQVDSRDISTGMFDNSKNKMPSLSSKSQLGNCSFNFRNVNCRTLKNIVRIYDMDFKLFQYSPTEYLSSEGIKIQCWIH